MATPTNYRYQSSLGAIAGGRGGGDVAPSFTSAPALIGTPQVGVAIGYTPGTATGTPDPTITRQWTIDGADMIGETGATYTPITADVGKALRVRLTASNGTLPNASSTSAVVSVVAVSVPGSNEVPVDKYRFQKPQLFHPGKELATPLIYTNHLNQVVDTGLVRMNDGTSGATSTVGAAYRFGPTYDFVCAIDFWPWANAGGDWVDANGDAQGTVPFVTKTMTAGNLPSGPSTHTFDVKTLVEAIYTQNRGPSTDHKRWLAILLKMTGGTVHIYAPGKLAAANGWKIDLTYSDATTETIIPRCVASLVPGNGGVGSARTTAMDQEVIFSPLNNLVLEFEEPLTRSKTITSAVMTMLVNNRYAFGGVPIINAYICAPPLPDMTQQVGIAANYEHDSGIEAAPGFVCKMAMVDDTTTIGDVLDLSNSGPSYGLGWDGNTLSPAPTTQHQESEFDPELWATEANKADLGITTWPTPAEQALKLPNRVQGPNGTTKWVGKTDYTKMRVVHHDDAEALADGFKPLYPGAGAIEFNMKSDELLAGQIHADGNVRNSQNIFMYVPKEHSGKLTDLHMRFYIQLANSSYTPNIIEANNFCQLGSSLNRGKYPEEVGLDWSVPTSLRAIDRAGKFMGGAGQQTRRMVVDDWTDKINHTGPIVLTEVDGGGASTAGALGDSGRFAFWEGMMDPDMPGPASGGVNMFISGIDYLGVHSIEKFRSTMQGWNSNGSSNANRYGCLGHIYPGRPYCVEFRFKRNTNIPYVLPPAGTHNTNAGYLEDAVVEWWIDSVKAGLTQDFATRSGRMITWALQNANGVPFGSTAAMRPMTNTTLDEFMGFVQLIIDFYYGGKTPNPRDKKMWVTGFVVTDGVYIGPMKGVSRDYGGLGEVTPPASGLPSWAASSTPGSSGEIPTSNKIDDLNPANNPALNPLYPAAAEWRGFTGGGFSGHGRVISAECGGAYDKSIDTWYSDISGGHNDYGGNERYKIDYRSDTPTFVMIGKPSGWDGTVTCVDSNESSGVYSDGRPRARHNWNSCVVKPGGHPITHAACANFSSGATSAVMRSRMTDKSLDADYDTVSISNSMVSWFVAEGTGACHDVSRNCDWILQKQNNKLTRYMYPAIGASHTGTFELVPRTGTIIQPPGAVSISHDPVHDLLLVGCGGYNASGAGYFYVIDLRNPSDHTPAFVGSSPALDSHGSFSPTWSAKHQCFFAWHNAIDVNKLTRIRPGYPNPLVDDWTVDTVDCPGAAITVRAFKGTYGGRGAWSDFLDRFVILNDTTQRPFWLKPSEPTTTADAWISTKSIGEWGVIPGSTIKSIDPEDTATWNPNYPNPSPWRASGGMASMCTAWNGAAWAEEECALHIPTSTGHNDGASNGQFRWDLNRSAPQWVMVREPSGAVGNVITLNDGQEATGRYSDGAPRAGHTYNGLVFVPGRGPMNTSQIGMSFAAGAGARDTVVYDGRTGSYVYEPKYLSNGTAAGVGACYDSTRKAIWRRALGTVALERRNAAPGSTWAAVGPVLAWSGSPSMTYMPEFDCLLLGNGGNGIVPFDQTVVGGWCVFDCTTNTYHYPTITGSGIAIPALGSRYSTGLEPGSCQPQWSSTDGCAYAWDNSIGETTKILRITPGADPRTSLVVSIVPVAGTNSVTPSAAPQAGTYGRAFYWDAKGVYIVWSSVTETGYFFRVR